MQKIKLIADTPCDIPLDIAKKNDIDILAVPITVDEKSYLESVDFDAKEFYNILIKAKNLPVTSHITAVRFYEKFETAYNEGYTHVITVTINAKGSSTYDAAVLARKNFYDDYPELEEKFPIIIIDSGTYSLGYGYPLLKAAEMIAGGGAVADVISLLDDLLSRVELVFTLFTLEYAKKSGRVKTAAAFMGEVLGFKPIMLMRDGEIKTIGKVRGNGAAMDGVLKQVLTGRAERNPEYLILCGMDEDITEDFKKLTKKSLGKDMLGTYDLGPSIAINAGPRVVGVMYFSNNQNKDMKHKQV